MAVVESIKQTPSYSTADVWKNMRIEAQEASEQQPLMSSFFHSNILNHNDFASAICCFLSQHIATDEVPAMVIRDVFQNAIASDLSLEKKMLQDLLAYYTRDPACDQYITPFLYFKGYHAIQSYRMAHWLWQQKRTLFAYHIQSRVSELFDVDIHPAASIDGGLMVDHASGVVIGETAVIEKNVSMLHSVTLGGSGCQGGDRHPKIRQGVLLSAGSKILGNIEIGEGAKIGAGSVVLESIPPHNTAVGVPAKIIGRANSEMPALDMDHQLDDV